LLTESQKRKRREYRVNRTAAFVRPEPGFSLYEGRTRGKRLRYTYEDDGDDFDSDDAPVRRSGRQSARDSSPAQSGPTVTASGRQVRSRATGTYGETLLSGQTTDRASPATGDYTRSDVSEEPRQGRSTRAGNRTHLSREVDSEEDEDATSWDGGDEDEDEPEPMDLDDNDEQDGAVHHLSDDEQEPRSLVVTLHYRKNPSAISEEFQPEETSASGVADTSDQATVHVTTAKLEHPVVPTAMAASQPAPISRVIATAALNGVSAHQSQSDPSTPTLQGQQPSADASTLSHVAAIFSAPTPPYSAPEDAPKQEQTRHSSHQPQTTTQ
jgi:hypothetical protein